VLFGFTTALIEENCGFQIGVLGSQIIVLVLYLDFSFIYLEITILHSFAVKL